MVVVDPDRLPERMSAAGFEDVQVDLKPHTFRFRARRKRSLGLPYRNKKAALPLRKARPHFLTVDSA
jgi:hypothetical protein